MKMIRQCTVLLGCGLWLVCAASAQKETLLIGPGDLLQVKVLDTPQLDETARVNDAGDLPLIFGGQVRVGSLNPEQAAHAIEQALINGNVMHKPLVLVTVTQYATQDVSVFGQVVHPGSYPITTARPVVDVLSMAGGFTDLASREAIIQRRGTGEQIRVSIPNDPKRSVGRELVNPGDEVIVPKAGVVYVLGDVGRPGGFTMNDNQNTLTALQALALAGGTPPSAVPNRARLIRRKPEGGYSETPLNLSAIQKGKEEDETLHANDVIYVPFSYARNIAVGLGGIIASAAGAALYAK